MEEKKMVKDRTIVAIVTIVSSILLTVTYSVSRVWKLPLLLCLAGRCIHFSPIYVFVASIVLIPLGYLNIKHFIWKRRSPRTIYIVLSDIVAGGVIICFLAVLGTQTCLKSEFCVLSIARASQETWICEKITSKTQPRFELGSISHQFEKERAFGRGGCYTALALRKRDAQICAQEEKQPHNECYLLLSRVLPDPALCKKILIPDGKTGVGAAKEWTSQMVECQENIRGIK